MDNICQQLAIFGGKPVRSKPWPIWPRADNHTEELLRDVLYSGRWTASGFYHGHKCYERKFAEAFADFCQVDYCTPVASGTSALMTALEALDIGPGDEVLVPGITWIACASAVAALGAKPVLVDIDQKTLCMCPQEAQKFITPQTAAIMVVHLYCSIADMDSFNHIMESKRIPIIEDCSQAHGAIWNGKRVGSIGTIGVFSMQQSKVLTCGEGGAVICKDFNLYRKIEQLRADGRMFSQKQPRIGHMELVEVGEVQGHNRNLSEFHAAILLDRLPHLDDEIKYREKMANLLAEDLNKINGIYPLEKNNQVQLQTIYQFCARLDLNEFSNKNIETICRALSAELNALIEPIDNPLNNNILYQPNIASLWKKDKDTFGNINAKQFKLPNAEKARKEFFTFSHHLLLGNEEDIEDITRAIVKVKKLSHQLTE